MNQKMTRKPTSVGEMLNEEFLIPLNMSQRELAHKTGYEVKAINRLINGKTRLSPKMAEALHKALGPSVGFWENCQKATDEWLAKQNQENANSVFKGTELGGGSK